MTPGMHVSVVNSYDAASLSVAVKVLRRVDCKQKKVLYGNHAYKLKAYAGLNNTQGQIFI